MLIVLYIMIQEIHCDMYILKGQIAVKLWSCGAVSYLTRVTAFGAVCGAVTI